MSCSGCCLVGLAFLAFSPLGSLRLPCLLASAWSASPSSHFRLLVAFGFHVFWALLGRLRLPRISAPWSPSASLSLGFCLVGFAFLATAAGRLRPPSFVCLCGVGLRLPCTSAPLASRPRADHKQFQSQLGENMGMRHHKRRQ